MNDTEHVLAKLRGGLARLDHDIAVLRIARSEIEDIGMMLSRGFIDPIGAVRSVRTAALGEVCGFAEGDNGFRLLEEVA